MISLGKPAPAFPDHAEEEPAMSEASVLRRKAEMFEQRAEKAADPLSKRHYREMAAHYRQLVVEHLDTKDHETAA
jgi:hypothetical protein